MIAAKNLPAGQVGYALAPKPRRLDLAPGQTPESYFQGLAQQIAAEHRQTSVLSGVSVSQKSATTYLTNALLSAYDRTGTHPKEDRPFVDARSVGAASRALGITSQEDYEKLYDSVADMVERSILQLPLPYDEIAEQIVDENAREGLGINDLIAASEQISDLLIDAYERSQKYELTADVPLDTDMIREIAGTLGLESQDDIGNFASSLQRPIEEWMQESDALGRMHYPGECYGYVYAQDNIADQLQRIGKEAGVPVYTLTFDGDSRHQQGMGVDAQEQTPDELLSVAAEILPLEASQDRIRYENMLGLDGQSKDLDQDIADKFNLKSNDNLFRTEPDLVAEIAQLEGMEDYLNDLRAGLQEPMSAGDITMEAQNQDYNLKMHFQGIIDDYEQSSLNDFSESGRPSFVTNAENQIERIEARMKYREQALKVGSLQSRVAAQQRNQAIRDRAAVKAPPKVMAIIPYDQIRQFEKAIVCSRDPNVRRLVGGLTETAPMTVEDELNLRKAAPQATQALDMKFGLTNTLSVSASRAYDLIHERDANRAAELDWRDSHSMGRAVHDKLPAATAISLALQSYLKDSIESIRPQDGIQWTGNNLADVQAFVGPEMDCIPVGDALRIQRPLKAQMLDALADPSKVQKPIEIAKGMCVGRTADGSLIAATPNAFRSDHGIDLEAQAAREASRARAKAPANELSAVRSRLTKLAALAQSSEPHEAEAAKKAALKIMSQYGIRNVPGIAYPQANDKGPEDTEAKMKAQREAQKSAAKAAKEAAARAEREAKAAQRQAAKEAREAAKAARAASRKSGRGSGAKQKTTIRTKTDSGARISPEKGQSTRDTAIAWTGANLEAVQDLVGDQAVCREENGNLEIMGPEIRLHLPPNTVLLRSADGQMSVLTPEQIDRARPGGTAPAAETDQSIVLNHTEPTVLEAAAGETARQEQEQVEEQIREAQEQQKQIELEAKLRANEPDAVDSFLFTTTGAVSKAASAVIEATIPEEPVIAEPPISGPELAVISGLHEDGMRESLQNYPQLLSALGSLASDVRADNIVSAFGQKQDLSMLKSLEAWEALGFRPDENAQPITVKTAAMINGSRLMQVYDMSQMRDENGNRPQTAPDPDLTQLARAMGIDPASLKEAPEAALPYRITDIIRESMGYGTQPSRNLSQEFLVRSAAYAVCSRFGLDVDNSKWAQSAKALFKPENAAKFFRSNDFDKYMPRIVSTARGVIRKAEENLCRINPERLTLRSPQVARKIEQAKTRQSAQKPQGMSGQTRAPEKKQARTAPGKDER